MIFRQWELVLSGHKTQTRRLWKPDYVESVALKRILAVYRVHGALPVYELGQRLPVIPKRGQKAIRDANGNIQRVYICNLRREHLQDISESDAIAEGVNSVEEYRELWQAINGKTRGATWDDNPLVVVITFNVVKG